jgi:hypothetical protein
MFARAYGSLERMKAISKCLTPIDCLAGLTSAPIRQDPQLDRFLMFCQTRSLALQLEEH